MTSKTDVLLLKAAQTGNLPQVQAILAQGANIDAIDRDGTTALMFASQQGYTEIVRVLKDAGANLNLRRKRYGLTALMLAAAANIKAVRPYRFLRKLRFAPASFSSRTISV